MSTPIAIEKKETKTVEELLTERGEHSARISEIDSHLKGIQSKINSALGVSSGVKRGPKPKMKGIGVVDGRGKKSVKKEKLLAAASKEKEPLSAAELAKAAKVEQPSGPLKALVADGLLKMKGKGRGAVYVVP